MAGGGDLENRAEVVGAADGGDAVEVALGVGDQTAHGQLAVRGRADEIVQDGPVPSDDLVQTAPSPVCAAGLGDADQAASAGGSVGRVGAVAREAGEGVHEGGHAGGGDREEHAATAVRVAALGRSAIEQGGRVATEAAGGVGAVAVLTGEGVQQGDALAGLKTVDDAHRVGAAAGRAVEDAGRILDNVAVREVDLLGSGEVVKF